MVKVTAVIVTNNRLTLLREAIAAVKTQTYPLHKVIIVNNASTDGTTEWLTQQTEIDVINQMNLGGSGGFYTGIEAAVKNADYIWVMDDDTICCDDTLEILMGKITAVEETVGFVGSKSIWKDNSPHLMNIPAIKPSFNGNTPFNKYDGQGVLVVETSSFVSLLINSSAVKKIGLPYKEFFIWGDDQEYTRRITKAGFLGLYCPASIVLHKTPKNYFPDFYRDTVANLWKHRYGFRNEFFMIKKNKGLLYFLIWLILKIVYTSGKLITIRRADRRTFIGALFNSAWQSIFFNPQIKFVS